MGLIRFGRPVVKFLTDLLYLPKGDGPMALEDRVVGTAEILQQGWARRKMRFSSSAFFPTAVGTSNPVFAFLDDPAFVSPGFPEKAIIRQDTNRVVIYQWQPSITGPTIISPWTNAEGASVQLGVALFRGDSFDGLTIPGDALLLKWIEVFNTARFRGVFPHGGQEANAPTTFIDESQSTLPIFVPAGWGLGFYGDRNGNWVNANEFGMIRSAVLDVPAEVKPY